MIPIIAALASQGLSLIANAVMAKGKDYIEQKTGISLDPQMSEESLLKLKQFQLENEQELAKLQLEDDKLSAALAQSVIEYQKNEDNNVTSRWTADASTDSWLAKNIRPLSLVAVFFAYFLFAGLSAANINVTPAYVALLGQWGQLIMTAYFGGRSLEKITELVQNRKAATGDSK